MNKEMDKLWNALVEYGIATEREIILVTNINGLTLETLESILYARTALRNLEQLKNETDFYANYG